jgi:DNA-directed RNA polymerase specialized sigma24 family protein
MPPKEQQILDRLDRISTHWSTLFTAHAADGQDATAARQRLVLRYQKAIFRYLLALVGDLDAAEEISQEFALNVLSGDFHRATPTKGRFRDYVKASLLNAVRKHRRQQSTAPGQLPPDVAEPDDGLDTEPDADALWREEVLNQTWRTLKEERPAYHLLLRLRIDEPEMTSRELAERLQQEMDRPMTAVNVRKTLPRAQAKFAALLVCEVAATLEPATFDALHAELEELDLLKYCRTALSRWQGGD